MAFLLIVPVVTKGKSFKALVDSGATRCFISPSCVTVAGIQGKRSDTFLELGNGQLVLSRGYVLEVPVTLSGHTSTVDLTVTSLVHSVDVVLGMTWLKSVRPVIDWVSGEVYTPNSVSTRDVPGKEREKTGTGKKRERNVLFPFPFLHFWAPVFFPFLAKIMKNG